MFETDNIGQTPSLLECYLVCWEDWVCAPYQVIGREDVSEMTCNMLSKTSDCNYNPLFQFLNFVSYSVIFQNS